MKGGNPSTDEAIKINGLVLCDYSKILGENNSISPNDIDRMQNDIDTMQNDINRNIQENPLYTNKDDDMKKVDEMKKKVDEMKQEIDNNKKNIDNKIANLKLYQIKKPSEEFMEKNPLCTNPISLKVLLDQSYEFLKHYVSIDVNCHQTVM
jgi:hypothetical protein